MAVAAAETLGAEDEYDLRVSWEKARQSFLTSFKVDLVDSKVQTPEDVLSQLTLKRQEDDEKSAQFKVLKDVLGKCLSLVENLGGIAASGASMVSRHH
jgi:hypothetical protein